jgi:hypothetical protein
MKTASNDLHEIVHSLSPGEKRYFRQFASRHIIGGQNNYLALFDAVARQESYDEAALKQSLRDTSFVQYFPVAKRYLHQQIVESLYWFHRANSMEAQVQKNLLAADILLDKGLIGQSRKLLKKARKDIYACELFRLLPDLLERERAIMDRTLYKGATAQDLDDWEAEWNRALDSLQQEGHYACWSSSIAQLHYQKVAVRERSLPGTLRTLARNFTDQHPAQPAGAVGSLQSHVYLAFHERQRRSRLRLQPGFAASVRRPSFFDGAIPTPLPHCTQ